MKKLTVIAALAIAMLSPAVSLTANAATYRARVIVRSTGNGCVYDTKNAGVDISDITKWQDGSDETDESSSTQAFTAYIYAKPDAGYAFDGWYEDSDCSKLYSNNAVDSITINGHKGSTFDWAYEEKTLYAKFVKSAHVCTFHYVKDETACSITKECADPSCDQGGSRVTYTLNLPSGVVYDRNQHSASYSTVGAGTAECAISYSSGTAPVNAGTYQVTMAVDGGTAENSTITRDLVISPATIDSLTLDPSSVDYDGTTKSPTMTVKAGSLTLGSDDYDITAGTLSGVVGSPAEDVTTTVTVQGKGNFIGTKSASWTVKAPSGSFAADAVSGAGCTASGNVVTLTDFLALNPTYDSEKGTWKASMTIAMPEPVTEDSDWADSNGSAKYVKDSTTFVAVGDVSCAVAQSGSISGLSFVNAEGSYVSAESAIWVKTTTKFTYLSSLTYTLEFSVADIEAAKAAGKIEKSITVWSIAWRGEKNQGHDTGLKATTYTLVVPIDDKLILQDTEGRQIYPLHQHDWSVQSSGETLIAVECSEPDCPQGALMLSLVADSWTYNGTTYSAELKGADDFRVHVGATVGEVTYWAGETQLASPPKYTGEYEARVAATVLGEPYVLRQQFSIYKPFDGYTDGWELTKPGVEESLWVRYDTYAEASAAANDGDTVIYHGDTINQKTYDFTSDADITVSFLGTRLRHDADGNSIFRNDGSGKVTLVNARVLQPKNIYGQDVEIVGKAGEGGAFVFGDGVDFVHQTTVAAGLYEMTLKVSNIDLEIVGGTYQIKEFSLGDGGSVSISGGKFWSDFNPSAYVAPGYGVREISGDYKYEVVEMAEVVKEHVVDVTGGEPSEVEKWLKEKVSDLTAVMGCEYLKASFELDVDLITDATTVDITDFSVSGGFSFTITLNKNATPVVIRAAAAKLASRIHVADALGLDFAAIDAARLTVDVEVGKVTIAPKLGAASEFLKILIEKDNAN